MWFETTVGHSFKCNLSQPQEVTNISSGNGLTITFTMSQWEAFGINKTGDYNERKSNIFSNDHC